MWTPSAGPRTGRRVFVVSGRHLDAWRWRQGRCEAPLRFEAGEEGLGTFSAYLAQEPPDPVRILVDLVEEEFREETLPRVIGPDRSALIQARRRRLLGDPTYGCSLYHGREEGGRREDRILFTALTRPERLTPWLDVIARCRVPLAGVHTLPLLTAEMVKWIAPDGASPALVVTWQRAGGLRQTFLSRGRVRFSRLAVPPRLGDGEHAVWLRSEVEKVQRYIVRQGLLASGEALCAYVVASSGLGDALAPLVPSSGEIRYRLVSLPALGHRLGVDEAERLVWSEPLFVASLARRTPRHQYAPSSRIRDYTLHRARSGIRAASLFALAAGVLFGGSGLAGGYDAGRFAESLGAHAALYRQRYREAREGLPQAPAELPGLRFAVEMGEGLRAARTSPRAVLVAVSRGLEPHAGVRVEGVDWSAEADADPVRHYRAAPSLGSESGTVSEASPSGRTRTQSAEIRGRIEPFDGDYRDALEQVGGFADSLRRLPGVVDVEVLSLPLDFGSGASLRGDAGARAGAAEAPFSLRLRWGAGSGTESAETRGGEPPFDSTLGVQGLESGDGFPHSLPSFPRKLVPGPDRGRESIPVNQSRNSSFEKRAMAPNGDGSRDSGSGTP